MNILEHIRDLRKSIIWAFVSIILGFALVLYFFDSVIVFLYTSLLPFDGAGKVTMRISSLTDTLFISSLLEGFTTKIGISLIGGVIVALPVIIYAVLRFIFPALSGKERKIVLIALLFCSFFALVGIFVGCAILIPPDVFSQISVTLPRIALYYISIIVAYIFHFGINPLQESENTKIEEDGK